MQSATESRTWALAERPAHLISRVSRLMTRKGEELFRPLEVGVAAYPVLDRLRNGQRLTQRELVEACGTEQPSMAQLLQRMERDGLVLRERAADDRRSSLIALTERADALIPQVEEAMNEINADAVHNFTDAELATFIELLKRIISTMERHPHTDPRSQSTDAK